MHVPAPANHKLPVDKLAGDSCPTCPSYSSVADKTTVSTPPKAKAAVCNPDIDPAKSSLAVFKFPPPVQVEPLYSSVAL
jgi:hypothetical protein